MMIRYLIVLLLLPLVVLGAPRWTVTEIPPSSDPDGTGALPALSSTGLIKPANNGWCYYEDNIYWVGMNFYIDRNRDDGTLMPCQWTHTNPEQLTLLDYFWGYYDFLYLQKTCPAVKGKVTFMVNFVDGSAGLSHSDFVGHHALRRVADDANSKRIAIHESAHGSQNTLLGSAPVAHKWWTEAQAVAQVMLTQPNNLSVLDTYVPWPAQMNWGLGHNESNIFGQYHLGRFFEWLSNRYAGPAPYLNFDICTWMDRHSAALATEDYYDDWLSLADELGGIPGKIEPLRWVWAAFVTDYNTWDSTHMPSHSELQAPEILVYPSDVGIAPVALYNLSGMGEGETIQITVPTSGILDIQWSMAERCGGYPQFVPHFTIDTLDGTPIENIKLSPTVGSVRLKELPPGPVNITLASLEGTTYLPQFFINSYNGFLPQGPLGDQYDMSQFDPWPYRGVNWQCIGE